MKFVYLEQTENVRNINDLQEYPLEARTADLQYLEALMNGKEATERIELNEDDTEMMNRFFILVSDVEGCKPATEGGRITVYTGVNNNILCNVVVQQQEDRPVLIGRIANHSQHLISKLLFDFVCPSLAYLY